MPRKKSVKRAAENFRSVAEDLLSYCETMSAMNLSAAHTSLVYEGAIIKLYAAFEKMILEALVGAINNDTAVLSSRTNIQFPRHLTDEVCEYIITGNGYFSFHGRDGLIREIKKYVSEDHYVVKAVEENAYRQAIEQLCTLRNYAAHGSRASKQAALKAVGQQRIGTAGSWLKTQGRFSAIAEQLRQLAADIEAGAPY